MLESRRASQPERRAHLSLIFNLVWSDRIVYAFKYRFYHCFIYHIYFRCDICSHIQCCRRRYSRIAFSSPPPPFAIRHSFSVAVVIGAATAVVPIRIKNPTHRMISHIGFCNKFICNSFVILLCRMRLLLVCCSCFLFMTVLLKQHFFC